MEQRGRGKLVSEVVVWVELENLEEYLASYQTNRDHTWTLLVATGVCHTI